MPKVTITASQKVYYQKTLELPQNEYDAFMALQGEPDEAALWLMEANEGFTDSDVVASEMVENLHVQPAA